MTTPGQVSFDGREVSGVYLDLPGIGKVEFPVDQELHSGDEIEVTFRLKVAEITHGSAYDRAGVEKSTFRRTYKTTAIRTSVEITGHVSREQLDAAWRKDHGAAG
jgi:hypothetical protein